VPPMDQLMMQDETGIRPGGRAWQLWMPHVYSPAQNPGDSSGVNQYGRWAYGPWFWPPTLNIDYPPVPNPYFDPVCDPDVTWCEPRRSRGAVCLDGNGGVQRHARGQRHGLSDAHVDPKPYRSAS